MIPAAEAASLLMAAVLLWAGLEKARRPAIFAGTLRELGLPRESALVAAALVPATEVFTAVALIYRLDPLLTSGLIVALSGGFAAAGLAGLAREQPISCACFGPLGRARLGSPQLIALPLWWAGAALLHSVAEPALSGAQALAVVGMGLAAARLVLAWDDFISSRSDRKSAKEMYVWLRH